MTKKINAYLKKHNLPNKVIDYVVYCRPSSYYFGNQKSRIKQVLG
jgi:hypothetical protein